jgi:hypothetical protein
MQHLMKILVLAAATAVAIASTTPTWAHGDMPHPKCKKGYVLNDDHKCVKT